MTYDTTRVLDARIPVTVAELRLDTCAYAYGQSVTNLIKQSENFPHANWTKVNNPTITPNVAVAPDGTSSMDNLEDDSAILYEYLQQVFTPFVVTNFYDISLHIEKDSTPRLTRYIILRLQFGGSTAEVNDFKFDTNTGEFSTTIVSTSGEHGVIDHGDHWRIHISAKSLDVANTFGVFLFLPSGGESDTWVNSFTAIGSVNAWGAQCTVGSELKHYVKTTTATATGSCDATDAKANLLTYSEQFDHANWNKYFGSSVVANAAYDPEGVLTADQLVFDGTPNGQIPQLVSGLTIGEQYTFSLYVKSDGTTQQPQKLFVTAGSVVFTPSTDWQRIVLTITATGTSHNFIVLNNPNSVSSFYAWGAQVVEGVNVGAYYKTEATPHMGTVGAECYNTFLTCQDTPNYTKHLKTHRFYQPVSNWPIGQTGYPCIKGNPTFTPCEIDPKGSFGKRGVVSFKCEDFADDDLFTDNYQSTRSYTPENQGTFFRKLKARNPYYKGRLMKIRQGYIGDTFSFNDFEDRLYVIESIDIDQKGIVKITGKDLLKLADNKKAVAPVVSSGTLSTAYTAGDSTLVLQTGDGSGYSSGNVSIGDNVLSYSGVSTDTLTGVTGGVGGSTDDDASIGDIVQQCLTYTATNVIDIIHGLLKTYAGIDESYLPYDAGLTVPTGINDDWDIEKASWLSGNDLTHIVINPTGVTKLIESLCKQNLIYMWFDERDQEIKLKAIAPTYRNELPPTLTESEHLIKDSIKTKDADENRISQIWVYYDQINIAGDNDSAENYKKLKVQVDTDSEGPNAYSEKAIKVIYADWLGSANEGLIITLAGRLLSRYAGRPEKITFKIDTKDADFWTGALALLDTFNFQDVDGANKLKKIQVMKVKDDHDKQLLELTAESWDYSDNRYGFIAPDSMGDYTAETALNQQSYGFICQNDGLYTNSDIGHLIA